MMMCNWTTQNLGNLRHFAHMAEAILDDVTTDGGQIPEEMVRTAERVDDIYRSAVKKGSANISDISRARNDYHQLCAMYAEERLLRVWERR